MLTAQGLLLARAFSLGIGVGHGGDQYAVLDGLASDDVVRMELYLATGERIAVPLRDNVYFVQAPRTRFPVRLVAYDSADRVIGIETFSHDPLGPRPAPDRG